MLVEEGTEGGAEGPIVVEGGVGEGVGDAVCAGLAAGTVGEEVKVFRYNHC